MSFFSVNPRIQKIGDANLDKVRWCDYIEEIVDREDHDMARIIDRAYNSLCEYCAHSPPEKITESNYAYISAYETAMGVPKEYSYGYMYR